MASEDTAAQPAEETVAVEHTRSTRHYRPDVDIYEKGDELILLADMPGANAEKIDVEFEDGMLTIHAEVDPRQAEDTEYLLREYEVGDYHRTFQLSESIEASKITAEYTDGVLRLALPKADAAKPRKITVKS